MKSPKRIRSGRNVVPPGRFASRRSTFAFVACLGIWLPRTYGATLVDLDATGLAEGPLATWNNTGTLPGNFTVPAGGTVPAVTNVAGVKGVAFLATGGAAGGTH